MSPFIPFARQPVRAMIASKATMPRRKKVVAERIESSQRHRRKGTPKTPLQKLAAGLGFKLGL